MAFCFSLGIYCFYACFLIKPVAQGVIVAHVLERLAPGQPASVIKVMVETTNFVFNYGTHSTLPKIILDNISPVHSFKAWLKYTRTYLIFQDYFGRDYFVVDPQACATTDL